ncbi:gluconolactonase [Erythrobacter sp. SG61-1L]|uniref:SMP-30/gluconolactonase/LRE family protein n=1 Tax=Erythrobacter sp. SG61-1L TaxID=1603897 RepID=UPI0006C91245|nr:SMP-30/gluconolactonase/LRE family protein [Erythrobacter sp. SG61-1L]KPL68722.1 gluconolactonase [Erythrobacter sp. SG61-1L]
MQTFQPIVALDARAELGESPIWHAGEKRLYWVDIFRSELHRFDPATGTDESRAFDQALGCFAFRAGGGFLLAMKDGLATLDSWDAQPVPYGDQMLAGKADLRLNDGCTDPAGRFWVGSVNEAKSATDAALYRADADGTVTFLEGGMTTCNSAGFSADGTMFCHADSPSHMLRAYDADPASGALSNRRILHHFPEGKGTPDGGWFDMEGCFWVALFGLSDGGGKVVRLSPQGEILATVEIPTHRTTMIGFGGEDMRTAYVTSARALMSDAELERHPHAGAIFSFQVDVPGVPATPFAG